MRFGTRYQTREDECDTGPALVEGPPSRILILPHFLSNEDDFVSYSTSSLLPGTSFRKCNLGAVLQGPALDSI